MPQLLTASSQSEIVAPTRKRPLRQTDMESDFFSFLDGEERKLWPSGSDLELLSSTQNDEGDFSGPKDRPVLNEGEALNRLIEQWVDAAVSHAVIRDTENPSELVATVAGINGAWGYGGSDEEALKDLKSVLIDWVRLKLQDGDDDIPSMEGLHLVVDR